MLCTETWKVVARMLEMPAAHKLTHDLKPQLAALLRPSRDPDGAVLRPIALGGRLVDVCIAAWLVMPDCFAISDNPNTAGFRVCAPHVMFVTLPDFSPKCVCCDW